MKKSWIKLPVLLLAVSTLSTSCIGSFQLTKNLLHWNKGVSDSKFVNELVFFAFNIIPVYGISALADVLVVNSIEFWSGDNPAADVGTVKNVETERGTYAITTKEDGYSIQLEGEDEIVDLVYSAADKSWSAESEGISHKLLQFGEENEVVMYLPTGETMDVKLDAAGVLAFRQAVEAYGFYATK